MAMVSTAAPDTVRDAASTALQALQSPAPASTDLLLSYELSAGGSSVRCLAVCDAGRLAGGAQDNMVHVWSEHGVATKLPGHERIMGVDGVPAILRADQWLASGGKDGTIPSMAAECSRP